MISWNKYQASKTYFQMLHNIPNIFSSQLHLISKCNYFWRIFFWAVTFLNVIFLSGAITLYHKGVYCLLYVFLFFFQIAEHVPDLCTRPGHAKAPMIASACVSKPLYFHFLNYITIYKKLYYIQSCFNKLLISFNITMRCSNNIKECRIFAEIGRTDQYVVIQCGAVIIWSVFLKIIIINTT